MTITFMIIEEQYAYNNSLRLFVYLFDHTQTHTHTRTYIVLTINKYSIFLKTLFS